NEGPGYKGHHNPGEEAQRSSEQGHIAFDGRRNPGGNRIGHGGTGFYMPAGFFYQGRVVVGGHGLGMAAAAIEEAWEFVHGRSAFGRDISEFQAVQHDLSDMLMEFERARALNWRAADKVANQENTGYWAALAKANSTEAAVECAERGMQLHGGRSVLD